MAVVYRSKVPITTLARRRLAYEYAAWLFLHLHALNINLTSIVRLANGFVEVTLETALPTRQVDHLELQGPI